MMIKRFMQIGAFAAAACLAGGATALDETNGAAADKSQFNLFNPTPRDLMRELSADRPDATETPITVDAGHVQVELSFFDYTRDKERGRRSQAWTVADTNLKLGVTNDMELQLIFRAYSEERVREAGSTTTDHGFSDVQLRWKINVWGNEGESPTAFAVMPFINIPTGTPLSTEEPEGGLAAMLAWDVAERWGLGFLAEVGALHNDETGRHDAEFTHTAVLGLDVVGPLGAYLEYVGILNSDPGTDYQALFSTGVTLALGPDIQLDAGTQIGLTRAADDLNVFTGITFRY